MSVRAYRAVSAALVRTCCRGRVPAVPQPSRRLHARPTTPRQTRSRRPRSQLRRPGPAARTRTRRSACSGEIRGAPRQGPSRPRCRPAPQTGLLPKAKLARRPCTEQSQAILQPTRPPSASATMLGRSLSIQTCWWTCFGPTKRTLRSACSASRLAALRMARSCPRCPPATHCMPACPRSTGLLRQPSRRSSTWPFRSSAVRRATGAGQESAHALAARPSAQEKQAIE